MKGDVVTASIHLKDPAQVWHVNPGSRLTYEVIVSPVDAELDFTKATIVSSDPHNAPAKLAANGRLVNVVIPGAANPVPFTLTWACVRDFGPALVASVTHTIVRTA